MRPFVQSLLRALAAVQIATGLMGFYFSTHNALFARLSSMSTVISTMIDVGVPLALAGIVWIYSSELTQWILNVQSRSNLLGTRLAAVFIVTRYAPLAIGENKNQVLHIPGSIFETSVRESTETAPVLHCGQPWLPVLVPILILASIKIYEYFKDLDSWQSE